MKRLFVLMVLCLGLACCGTAQNSGFTSLGNEEFAKVIQKKKTQLVDVRTPKEYAEGHLPKAINLDVNNKSFETIAEEKLNKRKPVAVYCRSGKRSKIAATKLSAQGYTVYELDRGILHWDGEVVK